VGVDQELSVDGVGDASLEGPDGFFLGLAFGDLALKIANGPAARALPLEDVG
jgi:hypothetical protein